jgi:hypothetical protein
MIEIIIIASLSIIILLGIIKLKDGKINDLKLENQGLKSEKELGEVTNDAKNSRILFDTDKADYDAWKSKFSIGQKDPKSDK